MTRADTAPVADLGREGAAAALAMSLDEFLRGPMTSASFAVTGQWGAGKTTLLQDALRRVQPRRGDRASVVPFTPWMYANEAAIFDGFALLLLQTLRKGRLRRRVAAGLRVLAAPLQALPMDFSATAQTIADVVDVALTPEQIQQSLADALQQQQRRVLLVVDDLDRLDPGELLAMFKLLRLIADVPNIAYVLVFDEDTLLHLLQQTPIGHGSRARARQYLEKLIERRVEVHPLTASQMATLLQPALDGMPSKQFEQDGLGSFRLDVLFESRLTTPRAIERFTEALRAVPHRLTGEVSHWDLCAAVFLRMFFPDVWALIVRERRTLTADSRGFGDYFGDGRTLRAAAVRGRLLTLCENEPDGADLRQLLEHLFPALSALAEGREASMADRLGQQIGKPDYIDRYLWLDLPPGSFADADVREPLRALEEDDDVDTIAELIGGRPSSGIAALERAFRAGVATRAQVLRVLDATFRLGDGSRPHQKAVRDAAAALARTLILAADLDEFDAVLRAHGDVLRWPLLRYLLVRDGQLADLPPHIEVRPLLEAARSRLTQQLVEELRHSPSPNMDEEEVRRSWFDLRRLDLDAAQSTAAEQFTAMRWGALDIASLGLSFISDSAGYFVTLDIDRLRRLVGDELVDRLRQVPLPAYPASLDAATEWRLHEDSADTSLATHIAAFVLTTGLSFGDDPFSDHPI